MGEVTKCKKALVYTFLGLNIFVSLLILFLLSLATYDVSFLDWYQYLYLVLAYIVWLLLFCIYIAKLVLILIGKLPTKFITLTWMVLNIPALVFFLIAFIFDLVMYSDEQILLSLYIILFVVIFILFLVFTGFDFFLIKIQIEMSLNNGGKKDDSNNNNEKNKKEEIAPMTSIKEFKEDKPLKTTQKDNISQNEKINNV